MLLKSFDQYLAYKKAFYLKIEAYDQYAEVSYDEFLSRLYNIQTS